MNIDFDQKFFFNTKAMRITYSHPDVARDKKWLIKFFFMQGISTLVFISFMNNIIFYDLKTLNFSRVCTNGIYCLVYTVITVMYGIMVNYQDILKKVIAAMKTDFEDAKVLSKEEQETVIKYADKGRWVTIQWCIIAVGGVCLFLGKSIVLTIYYAMTEGFRYVPFIDLNYPEIIESRKTQTLVFFGIVYAPMMFLCIYCAAIYAAFVPLGPMFMLHACGQLELLVKRIDKLYEGRSREEIREELRLIAKRLQYIYSFTDDIKACFRVIYEVTMKGSAIMLPLALYETIESIHRHELSVELVTFLFGGIIISSTPCFCSDLLMEKGDEVRMALYMCGWEREHDLSVRSTLVIMLIRALRPTAIRTMFRVVSLEALTDLFQQAYAIYNLMNAMWK